MEKTAGGNAALEQFVLLAKTAKGAAAVELVKQALEAPGVYVFGELLDMPHIQELNSGQNAAYFNLLNVFAYGTYSEYKANMSVLPPVTATQLRKLKHLTIVSLATKNKCLPYTLLLKELELSNLRELEDLIIEAVYADIIRGKLDQKHQRLEVEYAIGRDIRPEMVREIASVLTEWCSGCEALLHGIEVQVTKANRNKESQTKLQQSVDQEVTNIKKTLKATHQQDLDEQMVIDCRDLHSTTDPKIGKKTSKSKGVRTASVTKPFK